jgi:DNA-nicking Smr family endonuclease
MSAKKTVPPEDEALFRSELAGATPLRAAPRAMHQTPRPAPVPRQRLRDERAVMAELLLPPADDESGLDSGEELQYLRDGLSSDVLRKLRRGHWVIQDDIDLHGMTRAESAAALAEFIAASLAGGFRCVRIVHGKGLRSKNREPVLKALVGRLLMRKDEVLAYCQARRHDGGSGAVVVLLKSAAKPARSEA